MKHFLRIFTLSLLSVLLLTTSCNKDDKAELNVTPASLSLDASTGAIGSFSISCNKQWTIIKSGDWLSVSTTAGNGNGVVSVSAQSANTNSNDRQASLTIICEDLKSTVQVTQKGMETELKLSNSSLTLLSADGSVGSFNINCNKDWTLTCSDPEWLSVSSSSGHGNATVNVTAKSMNASSQNRSATLTVTSEGLTASVDVVQEGAFVKNCTVSFKNLLVMAHSVSFDYELGANVSYFYSGYLESSAAGWTDDRIAETLASREELIESGDVKDFTSFPLLNSEALDEGTDYYLCAVGYDKNGKRGDLTKVKIHTLVQKNSDPWVRITDVKYNSTYWFWTTDPDGYTDKFYQIIYTGVAAQIARYLSDAYICRIIKDGIADGNIAPIKRKEDWNTQRNNTTELYIGAWGQSNDTGFSPILNHGYYYIGTSSNGLATKSVKTPLKPDFKPTAQQLRELRDNVRLYVVE